MSNIVRKRTELDFNQYDAETFDTELQARRVILVGGEGITIQANVEGSKSTEYRTIEVPVIVKEVQIERVEVPVIVKEIEIREIEKQVVVTEYKIIEIPTVVIKPETVYIDKPVVTLKEVIKLPNWANVTMILQAAAIISLIIKLIK